MNYTGSTIKSYTASVAKRRSTQTKLKSFFSRMRRGELGHHHHIAGPYLIRFAQEAAWREDYKRVPNGGQVDRIVALSMKHKPSVDFAGYWQRHIAA